METRNHSELDLAKSLDLIKQFISIEDLEQFIDSYCIDSMWSANYALTTLVPILYRLGLVEKGLAIAERCMIHKEPTNYQSYIEYISNTACAEKLNNALLLLKEILIPVDYGIVSWNIRIKSFFSLMKKGRIISDCDDLLGIECVVNKSFFFSDSLKLMLKLMSNKCDIIKLKDLLYSTKSYKYIPCIIMVINFNGTLVQFKIKVLNFSFSELGMSYFIHKGYNIDSLQMNLDEELYRIICLNELDIENSGDIKTLSKFMFDELISTKYIHSLRQNSLKVKIDDYKKEISMHKRKIE